jgi:uncharacterized repeat protein (TIGR03806 family)
MNELRVARYAASMILSLLAVASCGSGPATTSNALPGDKTPPSVPLGLVASAVSSSQIQLSWALASDSGSGVAGYRIFRGGSAVPVATTQSTGYQDTGLIAGTTYAYTVLAFDGAMPANESAHSAGASASTLPAVGDTVAPTIPQALIATAISTSQILLTWQASTDAGAGVAGYRVFRNAGAIPVAIVQSPTFTDSGLTANTAYSYTLSAFDAVAVPNVSALSTAAVATTQATPPVMVSGLDVRRSNTSCLAGDAPGVSTSFSVARVFPNLTFDQPLLMIQEPASAARWYVVEKAGYVRVFENQVNVATSTLFADVTSQVAVDTNEMGLLGMAFHPNYPTDNRVYLSYNAMESGNLVLRIAEYRTQTGLQSLNVASMRPILTIRKPQDTHNGGNIAFGPDNYLYIGVGDGGGANDEHLPIGNGQRLSTLLGKMLRIDVNATTGSTQYAIPTSNPFAGSSLCDRDASAFTQNCPEIYAFGFRNPWRWSFDRTSGELWVGDVGQNAWEEVDRVVKGGNYGWRCREGAHPFYDESSCGPAAAPPDGNGSTLPPIAEYDHAQGSSITGGFVYRGSALPALNGRYVFGDFVSGRIWSIARDTPPTLDVTTGYNSNFNISSFAQDSAGEIYVVDFAGTLNKLVPGAGAGRTIPTLLSATGCVDPANPRLPASGLIPYRPNAAFWSDGASKTRFMALPDGQQINITPDGDFDFPIGSVLVKNFILGSAPVETRLFMRHNDGNWAGYTYEWNAQGSDATRVVGGKSVTASGQSWNFPSEAQCLQCHTAAAGRTLGLEVAQLNGQFHYDLTGRDANQLFTLNTLQILSPLLAQPVDQLPAMPDPFGVSGTIGERARAYLHTNCSQCHRPGGGTPVSVDFRYTTPLASTNTCEVVPQNDLGISNARIIAIGGASPAARSMVVARINRTDSNSMPPIQPRIIDSAGVALLTNWINGLASCN